MRALSVSIADVHPDDDLDRVHEPERHRVPGHALHPQGLRDHLPPGAERPEEEAQLQGGGAGSHCVHAFVRQVQRQTERRIQDRARPISVRRTEVGTAAPLPERKQCRPTRFHELTPTERAGNGK